MLRVGGWGVGSTRMRGLWCSVFWVSGLGLCLRIRVSGWVSCFGFGAYEDAGSFMFRVSGSGCRVSELEIRDSGVGRE